MGYINQLFSLKHYFLILGYRSVGQDLLLERISICSILSQQDFLDLDFTIRLRMTNFGFNIPMPII